MSYLSQISRTKHVFDKRTLITILNALVFSGYFIVQTYGQIHQKVIYVDYKVSRTLLPELRQARVQYDHITPVLKELKWLPVVTQLYFRNPIMTFKCLTSRVAECFFSQLIKR